MKKILCLFLFVFLVISMGCDSGSGGSKDTPPGSPGEDTFNESSLNLPDGVSITSVDGDMTSVISGMNYTDMVAFSNCISTCSSSLVAVPGCFMNCMNDYDIFPDGGAFNLCMEITNTTSEDKVITIEAGTRFNPADEEIQPMLVIYTLTITITHETTSRYCIPVYCLASSKHAPSSADDKYDIAQQIPATGCLHDIVAITSTKDIASFDHSDLSTIQDIIWDCADDGDIDTAGWESILNAMPTP